MSTHGSPSSINADETLKPERKKLKSCEPDLKITGVVDSVIWFVSLLVDHYIPRWQKANEV
jgi:hypothetical protein